MLSSEYDVHKTEFHRVGVPGGNVVCDYCKNGKTLIKAARYERHKRDVHKIEPKSE